MAGPSVLFGRTPTLPSLRTRPTAVSLITWVSSPWDGPPWASSRWRSAIARRLASLCLRRAATMRAACAASLGVFEASDTGAGASAEAGGATSAAPASFTPVPAMPASSSAREAAFSPVGSWVTVTVLRGSRRRAGRAAGCSATIHAMRCSRRKVRRSDRVPESFAETRTRTVTVSWSESVTCTVHVRPSHRSVLVRRVSTLRRMRFTGALQSSLSSTVPNWAAARLVQFSKGVDVK